MNAPACFAAASVFSHDSEVCRECAAFAACADASLETLNQIRDIVDVKDLLKRHERAKKVSNAAIRKADEEAAAVTPPGNATPPLMKPVERKTQAVKVTLEPNADDETLLATLPVKSRTIAVRLVKAGFIDKIKIDLAAGRNTFAEVGPGFLREALTLLLSGGFARSELKTRLQTALNWNESSAASHVSMVVPFFVAFRIAQESEGRLVPVPAVGA